jgi:predicted MFS family arabinose efflux permease
MSRGAWAAAFSLIAALNVLALIAFWVMRPRELAGDRQSKP